ncbi:hypothetical protein [Streptomyces griseoluteus]|uniref:hypothetical protein n=1 Tax=Streptomyces griseoluteus TaxID=29306 RepID=UPI00331E6644
MTNRRALGAGPQNAGVRAAQADLMPSMPTVLMPDLADMRARGVLGTQLPAQPPRRRTLGTGA